MTLSRRNRPVEITDAPEHRSIPIDRLGIEKRADSTDPNEMVLVGYASTFQEYDMYGGPKDFGWVERIDRSAFDKTLREKPDLHLLINHAGMPLARTKSGTLDLSVDDQGLRVEARLDMRDPEAQALAVKMERGDLDEMSFAFRVKGQEWRAAEGYEDIDDQSYRTITEVSLHKGDVSVVNWGANPTTSASVLSAADALKVLATCDEDELAEARSNTKDEVFERAMARLGADAAKVHIENLIINNEARAISDASWDPEEGSYSIEEWRRACLIDTGEGDPDSKDRYKLPVREPSGDLNRNGVHAAAGRIHEVDAPEAKKKAAANALVSIYKNDLKEDPPQALVDIARSAEPDLENRAENAEQLLAGLDATLDEACGLLKGVDRSTLPVDVAQACDLVLAATAIVGRLMDEMGVFDPDGVAAEGDEQPSGVLPSARAAADGSFDLSALDAENLRKLHAEVSYMLERAVQECVHGDDDTCSICFPEGVDEGYQPEENDPAVDPSDYENEGAAGELAEPITSPTVRGMRLDEALAVQGVMNEDGPLSLAAALSLA